MFKNPTKMAILFDSVILVLGIKPRETIIKVENNDVNLKNVNCVIKKPKVGGKA